MKFKVNFKRDNLDGSFTEFVAKGCDNWVDITKAE